MSLTAISPFYLSKWKPFRHAVKAGLITTIFFLLVWLITGNLNGYWWLSLLFGFFAFICTYIVLVISTLFSRWLNPPQKGFDTLNSDWWKP